MIEKKSSWLTEFTKIYLNNIEFPSNSDFKLIDTEVQKIFYKKHQPTGLLYGAPVITEFVNDDEFNILNDDRKLKYMFLSAIIQLSNICSDKELLQQKLIDLGEFYESIYYSKRRKIKKLLKKPKRSIKIAEKYISKRILKTRNFKRYLSISYNHNSLLFLDILFYSEWTNLKPDDDIEKLKTYMHNHYLLVLKVISAAIWANNTIEDSENYIFKAYTHSAQYSREERRLAKKLIHQNTILDDIDFSIADKWLIKKYLFEIAIFTIYSDRMIEHEESTFLQKLAKKLGLDEEEYESSFIAVESFMYSNWDKISVLKYKSHSAMIYGDLKQRVLSIGKKYKESFITEIKESKELMQLINKSRKEDLTKEEKDKIKQQFIDIFKTIPALSITLLPGGTVLLFALFEVLPKEFLPSGFKKK